VRWESKGGRARGGEQGRESSETSVARSIPDVLRHLLRRIKERPSALPRAGMRVSWDSGGMVVYQSKE
jgi:hypothetical protein